MKNKSKSLIITGFMGTGKTSVGKEIAKKLCKKFIDTDHFIEKKFEKTINEIFEKLGEKFFRNAEEELCNSIVKKLIL